MVRNRSKLGVWLRLGHKRAPPRAEVLENSSWHPLKGKRDDFWPSSKNNSVGIPPNLKFKIPATARRWRRLSSPNLANCVSAQFAPEKRCCKKKVLCATVPWPTRRGGNRGGERPSQEQGEYVRILAEDRSSASRLCEVPSPRSRGAPLR